MARRLAVQIYWRMCKEWDHEQFHEQLKKFGSQGRKLSFHAVLPKGSTR